MKKADLLDTIAAAIVPEGARSVRRDIGSGMTLEVVLPGSHGGLPFAWARMVQATVAELLAEVPEDAELDAAQLTHAHERLRAFYDQVGGQICLSAVLQRHEAEKASVLGRMQALMESGRGPSETPPEPENA